MIRFFSKNRANQALPFNAGLKIIMRVPTIFALFFFAAGAWGAESAVEIEFEYSPSFHDETLVYLARLPDGKIHCEVLTRPELGSKPSERKWKKSKEVRVTADAFARLERAFETSELKLASERDWPAIPDGSRWRLKKKKGSFTIEIVAHNPDRMAEGAPIVQLGHTISVTASAGLFPK